MAAVAAAAAVSSSSAATTASEEFFANVNALIQQQQQYQQQQQHFQQQLQDQIHPTFSKPVYRELSPFRTVVAQAAEEPESELRTTRPPMHSNHSSNNNNSDNDDLSPKNSRLLDKKPKMNTLDVAEAEELATRIRPWELKVLIEIYRTRARRNIRIKVSN